MNEEEKAKILIIDDDPDMVEALKIILESAKYSVITAYDGKEGFIKAKEKKPNLIILDLILPKEGGEEVCSKLKQDKDLSNIPVIILTAMAEKMNIKFFDESGKISIPADEYIDKPIQPQDLLAKIRKFLRDKIPNLYRMKVYRWIMRHNLDKLPEEFVQEERKIKKFKKYTIGFLHIDTLLHLR